MCSCSLIIRKICNNTQNIHISCIIINSDRQHANTSWKWIFQLLETDRIKQDKYCSFMCRCPSMNYYPHVVYKYYSFIAIFHHDIVKLRQMSCFIYTPMENDCSKEPPAWAWRPFTRATSMKNTSLLLVTWLPIASV